MKAMISSTALDLPEHRQQVVEACLRESVFPIGMEQLPARDATGVQVSLEMVDQADIYIGIFAWRYGWVPEGSEISITEMEFNRAVERQQRGELKEILVFVMHEQHDIKRQDIEADATAQEKLRRLKERASSGRVRKEFRNVDDLRGLVLQALADSRRRFDSRIDAKPALTFHPPNDIPTAPIPYVAHPYVLLQTKRVIGRSKELKLLTDWITKNEQITADTRIFSIVAIGGMGKSALTWKWFEDIAPNELPDLAGRIWWSFYESDAHWENFVIRTLVYITGMLETEVRQLTSPEREDRLLRLLDERPFLIVFDGLERILLAYARMDAAHLFDDDLDARMPMATVNASGLPEGEREEYLNRHRLRQCADVSVGRFLRKLARVRSSRVLLSSRLYPAELETEAARPLPGCHALFLQGLVDDDALALWRSFISGEKSGTSEKLLPLFRAFGNYPLLLRTLAGEVAHYRPAPGDFDLWRKDHPDFNPAALPLKNAKTHVLQFALHGLSEAPRQVLHTLAAFRMPATWDTLRVLLTGADKPCANAFELDVLLSELEDRGLLGWDKAANRYDLHPIVRGVIWRALDPATKRNLFAELQNYFNALPRPPHYLKIENLEELTSVLELFDKLIGLELFEDAFVVFQDHLEDATFYRLSASRIRLDLLERLFPDGVDNDPRLMDPANQARTLNLLGNTYLKGGEPGKAASVYSRAATIVERLNQSVGPLVSFLSRALSAIGKIREGESAARRAVMISRKLQDQFREGIDTERLGTALAIRGNAHQSDIALRRALAIVASKQRPQAEARVSAQLAQKAFWLRQAEETVFCAQQAWTLAHIHRNEADLISAARLQGQASLMVGDFTVAGEYLKLALVRARSVNLVEEELPALTALADLYRQQKEYDIARDLLEEIWTPAKRGPYPLWHADARNVLAQLERDLGHQQAAIEAATVAYQLAWCDGPPYAYDYGLTNARRHLQELTGPEPRLSPFDETKFPPMPDVEVNLKDEFWVDPEKLTGSEQPT